MHEWGKNSLNCAFFCSTPICMCTMRFLDYGASKSTKLFLLTCIIICQTKKLYAGMFSKLYSTTITCVFNITHRLLVLIILHIKFHLEYYICASQLFDILIHYSYAFNIFVSSVVIWSDMLGGADMWWSALCWCSNHDSTD